METTTIYIIEKAFQSSDMDEWNHWLSKKTVSYCASKEIAEEQIILLLKECIDDYPFPGNVLELLTDNKIQYQHGTDEDYRIADLFTIVEKDLIIQ